jgi:transcriptional activator SPT7
LNRQNSTEATANGTQNSFQSVNFGAASLSLKHLLTKIESKRDALALTDAELRKLLSDVRKNRSNSKWASEDLIGREELYEALESMLKKAMADKSAYPFLVKVRRQQAPDYHNIIRRPMDLGTVQRNLKTGTYFRSKAHFMEEVDLIWDNCLRYNTDPVWRFDVQLIKNHPLRPLAMAMRNVTAALGEFIPDITIRTRAEVEAEEAAAEAEEDAHSEDDKPVKSSRKAGVFSSKGVSQKGGKGGPSKGRGPVHEEILENKLLNGVREGSIAGSQDGRSSSLANGMYSTPPPGGTPGGDLDGQLDPAQVAEQAREEGGNDSDEGDVLSLEWSSQTQQARAKYALRRNKLLRRGPLTEEEQALIRTKKGMSKFQEWDDKAYDMVRFKEPEQELDPDGDDVLNDVEDDEEDHFLAEYDVAAGTLSELTPTLDGESIKELYTRDSHVEEYYSLIALLIQTVRHGSPCTTAKRRASCHNGRKCTQVGRDSQALWQGSGHSKYGPGTRWSKISTFI